MYEIIRFFEDGRKDRLYTNFSREDAMEYCKDPKNSSSTCSEETKKEVPGNWFVGFRKM